MSRRLIIRREAETDLTDAALWYDSREPGLGLVLTSEINSAIARVLASPTFFTRVRRNPEVRRVLTRRFPYRIFFIVRHDAIVVLPCFTPPDTIAFGSTVQEMSKNSNSCWG